MTQHITVLCFGSLVRKVELEMKENLCIKLIEGVGGKTTTEVLWLIDNPDDIKTSADDDDTKLYKLPITFQLVFFGQIGSLVWFKVSCLYVQQFMHCFCSAPQTGLPLN